MIKEESMRSGNYESSDGTGSGLALLLIGIGIGVGAGLLLAPKAGRLLRKDLRRSYDDARDTVSEWADEAKDRFADVVEKGSDFAEELRSKTPPLSELLRRS
jgi:gas vesicle protein